MTNVTVLREELREALAVLKEAVLNPVMADEVFLARSSGGIGHFPGDCIPRALFSKNSRWESVTRTSMEDQPGVCTCTLLYSALSPLRKYISSVSQVLKGTVEHTGEFLEVPSFVGTLIMYPLLFEAWQRVHQLSTTLLLSDADLVIPRARIVSIPIRQMLSVGECTMRFEFPVGLKVFPDGMPAEISWVTVPEFVAYYRGYGSLGYVITRVAGWPVERVSVLNSLIQDAAVGADSFAAFELAKLLVPA